MLEIGYFSSLYAQFRLRLKKIWAEDFQTLKATMMIIWSDYSNKFFI